MKANAITCGLKNQCYTNCTVSSNRDEAQIILTSAEKVKYF